MCEEYVAYCSVQYLRFRSQSHPRKQNTQKLAQVNEGELRAASERTESKEPPAAELI